jgi:hypothetical protein
MATPFPLSVTKGIDYGSVDPVMIGADIYGWAKRVEQGDALTNDERSRLASARDDLVASIDQFPPDARPYYEVVLDIADAALR